MSDSLRWVAHTDTFSSLMLGRIEIAQICKDSASNHWFYTLRFCTGEERASFSQPTEAAAKAVAEVHAHRVLS